MSPPAPQILLLLPFPGALTQAIRNFAKSLESWLGNAMVSMPEEMVRVKVGFGGPWGLHGGVMGLAEEFGGTVGGKCGEHSGVVRGLWGV